MKMLVFYWLKASFKICISKVQDFENFEFSPILKPYLVNLILKDTYMVFSISDPI